MATSRSVCMVISNAKTLLIPSLHCTKVFASGAARRNIFATPSKPAHSSPSQGREVASVVMETPSKMSATSPPPAIVAATTTAIDSRSAPVSATTAGLINCTDSARDGEEPSIYDALGWNEDDDDLG